MVSIMQKRFMRSPARLGFDYETLPASFRSEAENAASVIHHLVGQFAENVLQIGLHLIHVRMMVGRTHFQTWLRAEFQWSQATASNFMRVAKVFQDCDCLRFFQPSALYILAGGQVTSAAREEALDVARNGEMITKCRATEILQKHSLTTPQPKRIVELGLRRNVSHSLYTRLSEIDDTELRCLSQQISHAIEELESLKRQVDARLESSAERATEPMQTMDVATINSEHSRSFAIGEISTG
jgi:hypothetical protein